MLEEQTIPDDSIRVLVDGQIEVREATILLRDGARDPSFSARYHRYTLAPGDDLSSCPPRVAAIAASAWTPEVVTAWRESLATPEGRSH